MFVSPHFDDIFLAFFFFGFLKIVPYEVTCSVEDVGCCNWHSKLVQA